MQIVQVKKKKAKITSRTKATFEQLAIETQYIYKHTNVKCTYDDDQRYGGIFRSSRN